MKELARMEPDAIDLEYINKKTEYEHKKTVLSVLMITIVLSVLMDAWSAFYKFMEKVARYSASSPRGSEQIAKVGFVIAAILVVFVTIVVCIILVMNTRERRRVYRDLLIIETERERRGRDI